MTDTKTIRLLLADDHELVRDGIRARLENEDNLEIIGEAKDGLEAVSLAKSLQPDVIMMDVSMPQLNGLEATTEIRESGSTTGILILSIFDSEQYVRGALDAGANGYILKDVSAEEMIRAIVTVAGGGLYLSTEVAPCLGAQNTTPSTEPNCPYGLTRRETDVLRLIANGMANKQVAFELGISVRTVESHRQNLRDKLGGGNAVHLAKMASELGLN